MIGDPAPSVTAGDAAYERLRADIVFGRLAPGQRLRLEGLRSGYGVGIGTLREILSRLSAEGLVLAEGQRGFEVPPLSRGELEELAALRLLLERHALKQSFAAGDVEWEGRVVAAHHKLEVVEGRMIAGRHDEAPAWKRYDSEFHQALISACGSRTLMQAHANGFDRYLRYLMVAVCFRGARAAAEHRRLRDCALERDAEGAGRVLEEHIGACVRHVLGRLGARGDDWSA
jgi:DNA-binding GntR family transcriptional regulator